MDENPYASPQKTAAPPARPFVASEAVKPVGLVILLCVIAAIAYIGRSCMGVASKNIQTDLDLSVFEMGLLMSAFFWSYALAQIPTGILGHHYGPRRTIVFFAWLGAVACALFAIAFDAWSLLAVQIVFGISQAGLFPCAANAISLWVPSLRRALSTGALGAAMSVGGAAGTTLTGRLLALGFNWRSVYLLYAPLGLVWSIVFVSWFRASSRERPQEKPAPPNGEKFSLDSNEDAYQGRAYQDKDQTASSQLSQGEMWGQLIWNWDMWMICAQQFFRAAGYSFYLTWFPQYLQVTRKFSISQSGYFTTLPLCGVVIGSLCGGYIVDLILRATGSRRASRQGASVVSMIGSAGFVLAAYAITDPIVAVLLISAGSMFSGLAGSCSYTVTIDKAGTYVSPVFAAMNMMGNFGAAVCPVAVGAFLALTGENWQAVLLLFAGIYLAAGFCWCLLNPEGEFFSHPHEKT